MIRTLREIARKTGVSIASASAIEAAELKPYRELQQKLDNYREAFLEEIQATSSLSKETRSELQDYQLVLGLRDEDVQPIEAEILTDFSLDVVLDQIDEAIAPLETFSQIPSALPSPPPNPTFEFEVVTLEVQTSGLFGRNTRTGEAIASRKSRIFPRSIGQQCLSGYGFYSRWFVSDGSRQR